VSKTILLASGNRNKYFEFSDFFEPVGVDVLFGPDVLGRELEIVEDGSTYAHNALKKARAWADKAGMPALSDDSGLEVRALSWGPGTGSARVAQIRPVSGGSWRRWRMFPTGRRDSSRAWRWSSRGPGSAG